MTHPQDPEQQAPKDMSYWEVIAEIDATYFCLEQLMGKMARRSPIVQLVDEATGYDKEQVKTIKAWVARIKELQATLPADDPHFMKEAS